MRTNVIFLIALALVSAVGYVLLNIIFQPEVYDNSKVNDIRGVQLETTFNRTTLDEVKQRANAIDPETSASENEL